MTNTDSRTLHLSAAANLRITVTATDDDFGGEGFAFSLGIVGNDYDNGTGTGGVDYVNIDASPGEALYVEGGALPEGLRVPVNGNGIAFHRDELVGRTVVVNGDTITVKTDAAAR